MQLIDVRTDFAFKKVFGSEQSKDILISFLNAVLSYENNPIVDLTIINPYQIPSVYGLKETYVDIKAKLENGSTVVIEMQAYNQTGFGKRIESNLAKAYASQLHVGDKYTTLSPVIALTITDFEIFTQEQLKSSVITQFKFMETCHFIIYPDNEMEMVFVELPKFNKKESELTSILDKWIYFIKQAWQLTSIPQTLADEKTINHAIKIADAAGLTLEELDIQEKKARWLADQKEAEQLKKKVEEAEQLKKEVEKAKAEKQAALEMAKQAEETTKQVKTEKQTLLKKLAQAEEETKLQIAKQMLQADFALAVVMQVTGLDEVEIENLTD